MKSKEEVDLDLSLLDEYLQVIDKDFLKENKDGCTYSDEFWSKYKNWLEENSMKYQMFYIMSCRRK